MNLSVTWRRINFIRSYLERKRELMSELRLVWALLSPLRTPHYYHVRK